MYFLSIIFLGDKIKLRKVIALALCVGGVIIIIMFKSASDTGSVHQTFWGYVYCLCSVFLFALYEVLFKLVESHESVDSDDSDEDAEEETENENLSKSFQQAMLYLGLGGLINMIFFWIIIYILDAFGIEKYQVASSDTLYAIVMTGLMDTVSRQQHYSQP